MDPRQRAKQLLLDAIRTGARTVNVSPIQERLQADFPYMRPAVARQHAIKAAQDFAEVGIGTFIKGRNLNGRRDFDSRLENIL